MEVPRGLERDTRRYKTTQSDREAHAHGGGIESHTKAPRKTQSTQEDTRQIPKILKYPPLFISYAKIPNSYSPDACCSLDKGVAYTQHIQRHANIRKCLEHEILLPSAVHLEERLSLS